MPSENKTANIGLNQWQANEYPKREDFNADNLAIDGALGGKLSKTGDGKDVTVTFDEATTRENIVTGEPLKVILGKVSKFFRDLKTVAFTGSYNNLGDKPNDENLDVCEDTKAALGLTQPEPKVKDAFTKLSEIYLYWWEKYKPLYYTPKIMEQEERTLFYTTANSSTKTIYYSSSVKASNGNIILNNPLTLTVSYNTYTTANSLKNKYFKVTNNNDDTPTYLGGNSDATRRYNSGLYDVYFTSARVYASIVPETILGYVSSINPSTYVEGQNPDGYHYRPLGQPFVNARMSSKFVIVTYTGTGVFGDDNPISFPTSFEPRFALLVGKGGSRNVCIFVKPFGVAIGGSSGINMYSVSTTWSNDSLSFTGTSQTNEYNVNYSIFIGG